MNCNGSQLAGLIVVLLVNLTTLHGLSLREMKREMENEYQVIQREDRYSKRNLELDPIIDDGDINGSKSSSLKTTSHINYIILSKGGSTHETLYYDERVLFSKRHFGN